MQRAPPPTGKTPVAAVQTAIANAIRRATIVLKDRTEAARYSFAFAHGQSGETGHALWWARYLVTAKPAVGTASNATTSNRFVHFDIVRASYPS